MPIRPGVRRPRLEPGRRLPVSTSRPTRPRPAPDDHQWPPEAPPEGQHFPFLSLVVLNVLEATVIQGMYIVHAEVTNNGNAPSHFAIVELFEQFAPSRHGDPSPYYPRGFHFLGSVHPHSTVSVQLQWADERHAVQPVESIRRYHQISPWELQQRETGEFIARVYDPVLDPKPRFDSHVPLPHHTKVVRRPFSAFEIKGAVKGVIRGEY